MLLTTFLPFQVSAEFSWTTFHIYEQRPFSWHFVTLRVYFLIQRRTILNRMYNRVLLECMDITRHLSSSYGNKMRFVWPRNDESQHYNITFSAISVGHYATSHNIQTLFHCGDWIELDSDVRRHASNGSQSNTGGLMFLHFLHDEGDGRCSWLDTNAFCIRCLKVDKWKASKGLRRCCQTRLSRRQTTWKWATEVVVYEGKRKNQSESEGHSFTVWIVVPIIAVASSLPTRSK